MRKLKKVTALILCAVMQMIMLPGFSEAESAADNMQKKIDTMLFLGVLEETYEGMDYGLDLPVSRAEFAVYLQKLLGTEESTGRKVYYNDVSKNHYAYGAITAMTEYGYLNGVDAGKFDPENTILTEHAAAALLKIMGYGKVIEQTGITKAASMAELYSGTSGGSLTLGKLINLFYDALFVHCLEMSGSDNGKLESGTTTFLYYIRKMNYTKNRLLSGADEVSISGKAISENEVVIGGDTYLTNLKDMSEYLCFNVDFIWKENEYGEDEVIWIYLASDNDVKRIDFNSEPEYDNKTGRISYDDGNKTKSVVLGENTTIIYNGAFYYGKIEDVFSKPRFEMNYFPKVPGLGDVAVVWAYENVFVGMKGSDTDNYVYCEVNEKRYLEDMDSYDRVIITDTAGNKLTYDDITYHSVLSIYESGNKEQLKIVISKNTVEGILSGYTGEGKLIVDQEVYEYSDKTKAQELSIGKSVTLYLDAEKYVARADFVKVNASSFVAYLYNGFMNEDEDGIIFKLLKEDGTIALLNTSNKFCIDDRSCSPGEGLRIFGVTENTEFIPQLCFVNTNSDNKITKIYTASEQGSTKGKLFKDKDYSYITNRYFLRSRSGQNIIGNVILYNSKTKVFTVPVDSKVRSAKESEFSVRNVTGNTHYYADGGFYTYKTTPEDVMYTEYILRKTGAAVSTPGDNTKFGMVEKVFETLNDDDEVVKAFTVSGVDYSLDTGLADDILKDLEDKVDKLETGDLVRLAGPSSDRIQTIQMVFDISKGEIADQNSGIQDQGPFYPEAIRTIASGYPIKIEGTAMDFDYEMPYTYGGVDYSRGKSGHDGIADRKLNIQNVSVKLYEKGKVRDGTIADIRSDMQSGGGSFIVFMTNYNNILCLAVYNDWEDRITGD